MFIFLSYWILSKYKIELESFTVISIYIYLCKKSKNQNCDFFIGFHSNYLPIVAINI